MAWPIDTLRGQARMRPCHQRDHSPGRKKGHAAIEFSLLLMTVILLFAFVGEWLRFSLISQTLGRTTHLSARAVAAQPTATACEATVANTFTEDATASWLLDRNDDGTLDVVVTTADGWPADTGEVNVAISWEDNPNDGAETEIAWDDAVAGSCGGTGTWLRIRARAAPLPWYGPFRTLMPNGLALSHESWARNSRA